jgi:hypothetical protein
MSRYLSPLLFLTLDYSSNDSPQTNCNDAPYEEVVRLTVVRESFRDDDDSDYEPGVDDEPDPDGEKDCDELDDDADE